ncbi:UNVERIFIED_CONTAM: hypothetical protein FKN15_036275 [Acipenser sinensis]
MHTRCPPKRVPSAACFFTLCRLTVQLPQSYSVGGQRSSGQLTGKPAGVPARLQGLLVRDKKRTRKGTMSLSSGAPDVNSISNLIRWEGQGGAGSEAYQENPLLTNTSSASA